MYERLGHPTDCNYYYAMREVLGLDPKRKEDQEFFAMLVKTDEIKRTTWGNGTVSDTQFDTDSILAYQQRVRKKVERELEKLTKAIEDMRKDLPEIKELLASVAESLKELVEETKKGEGWQEKSGG